MVGRKALVVAAGALRLDPPCQGGATLAMLLPGPSTDLLAYRTQGIVSRLPGPGVRWPGDEGG